MQADLGTVIVTGGSRGIGAATARLCARRGYPVCIGYLTDSRAAQAVVETIEADGGSAIAVQGNTGSEADVERLVDEADRRLGTIVGLVNNAGIIGARGRLESVPTETLHQVLEVNVIGVMLCAREAARRMSTRRGGRGGAIVNVSSAAATIGSAGEYVHYAASKAAVDTFTMGFGQEVAREGIRVNAVSPGFVDTEIHARSGAPDRLERLAPTLPLGRPGRVEEVAEAILWLLSDAASYVTGTVLRVSGGR